MSNSINAIEVLWSQQYVVRTDKIEAVILPLSLPCVVGQQMGVFADKLDLAKKDVDFLSVSSFISWILIKRL